MELLLLVALALLVTVAGVGAGILLAPAIGRWVERVAEDDGDDDE